MHRREKKGEFLHDICAIDAIKITEPFFCDASYYHIRKLGTLMVGVCNGGRDTCIPLCATLPPLTYQYPYSSLTYHYPYPSPCLLLPLTYYYSYPSPYLPLSCSSPYLPLPLLLPLPTTTPTPPLAYCYPLPTTTPPPPLTYHYPYSSLTYYYPYSSPYLYDSPGAWTLHM